MPLGGSQTVQSGAQNQRWPGNGQGGYITPAALAVPTGSERGAKSEVAHKRARWLHNPCRLGSPHRFRARGRIRKCPTNGRGGYINPAAWGVPTASEHGAESEVAHKWARWLHNPCHLGGPTASEPRAESEVASKWARWLHNPCCLGGPHRFRAKGRIRSGPQVGKVAT